MKPALVIAAHGSELNPQARSPAAVHATALAAEGRFARVVTAYWKGEPHVSRILEDLPETEIIVVPFFMADGYYTRTILPREMKLKGPVTLREGKTIRYTPPVGGHPHLADIIIQRAMESGAKPGQALVLLGHGTERHRNSGDLAVRQAENIRRRRIFGEVVTVFIDQEPSMRRVFELVQSRLMVMVPMFAADGWHVSETIPEDLQMDQGQVERAGRILKFAPAIGTHPALSEVILQLAEAATAT